MKVFITKYALTTGIEECEANECRSNPRMIRLDDNRYFHGEGRDWHRTREAAVKRADAMRLDKILALNRQIRKLSKMEF